ncbi:HepT-like ribonuclease domain-containing protein [Reichenbachiella ulvae]|uniref:DUF86 domain-containing protein n=1 Tax=Reichenbachiella ulvae TaxID=2980104 RepID=A0ABT3CX03_9BACT|nr:HepT-like ribonuclease domain-containing protein [Reichenbachiella ulvae]MCV9388227.1 DUF86 domain-containing protein [Reichenbachiella ulvae]
MDERILKWLYDIHQAIEEIDQYFEYHPKDFLAYKGNTMLKRAVERDLEIIGEAMNRILKRNYDISNRITASRAIISSRNQVIHAYDNVSDENIWSILINHLPILKKEISQLIEEN